MVNRLLTKVFRQFNGGKIIFSTNGAEPLDSHMQKDGFRPYHSQTTQNG